MESGAGCPNTLSIRPDAGKRRRRRRDEEPGAGAVVPKALRSRAPGHAAVSRVRYNNVHVAEKEEQRRIREQMREEEQALRELERGRLDAEKEEKRYEDALTTARSEVERAVGVSSRSSSTISLTSSTGSTGSATSGG